MAKATNAFADDTASGLQRARGGFVRNSQGTPYITDPTGATVKSGDRKGQPKRIAYGSPSGAGKQIESTYNLTKWSERRVVLGIGTDLALIADCAKLAALEVDSDEYKEQADRIVLAAKEAAKTNLAANRGTFIHAILEDAEQGIDWLPRLAAGEVLDLTAEEQHLIVAGWKHMLDTNGLEPLLTEASCVDDVWHLAGTLDNIVRCTRELRFVMVTGETKTIPAGTVLVLDKKTSQRRVDSKGVIKYWTGFPIQIASYAQSKPYDTETEQRGEWPWPIDQQHALIGHIDCPAVAALAPVDKVCSLIYVDLEAGREHGGATVVRAKEWEKRSDVLSVAQIDAAGITQIAAGEETASTPLTADDSPAAPIDTVPPTVPTPSEPEQTPAPTVTPSPLRQAQLDRQAIDDAADAKLAATTTLATNRDEGATLDDADHASAWTLLQDTYTHLPRPSLTWISNVIREAREASVGFQMAGGKTARRFELYRATIWLAAQEYEPAERDEIARALAASAMNSTAPLDPAVPVGAAIGSLDAAGARRFADLAHGTPVFGCDNDGRFVVVSTELPDQPLAQDVAA